MPVTVAIVSVGRELPEGLRRVAAQYSPQSARCRLRRDDLRAQLGKLRREEANLQKQIAELQEEGDRRGKEALADNQPRAQQNFKQASENLSHKREMLAACREQCRKIEEEISQLTPGPAQQKARAGRQREFARLVAERLEKDRQAERALRDLWRSLRDRA